MADERKVIIELKVSEGGSGDEESSALKDYEKETNDLVAKLKKIQNPFGAIEQSLLKKSAPGSGAFIHYMNSNIKSLAKNSALYFINRYFALTENYKSEQDLSNTLSVLSHVGEAFTSIMSGAIAGAKGGQLPGAIAGAIAGATFWVGNTTINAMKAFEQEEISLSTMRIQSSYQRARLGLIDDGRGTQN